MINNFCNSTNNSEKNGALHWFFYNYNICNYITYHILKMSLINYFSIDSNLHHPKNFLLKERHLLITSFPTSIHFHVFPVNKWSVLNTSVQCISPVNKVFSIRLQVSINHCQIVKRSSELMTQSIVTCLVPLNFFTSQNSFII